MTDSYTDVIGSEIAVTLPGLFRRRLERSRDAVAYRQFDAEQGIWRDYTWGDTNERVAAWCSALAAEGLEKGDRVAILLPNGLDWVCFDQAALALGLVMVPFYTSDTPDNFAYFLQDSNARLLLVESEAQWDAIAAKAKGPFDLKRVVCREGTATPRAVDALVCTLADWLSAGAAPPAEVAIEPDDLATLIYTSGTTGRPKGVMLSHRNVLGTLESAVQNIPIYRDDVFISYLPMAHSFERTVGYYLPMMAGASVGYARSVQTLTEDLLTIRPTLFVGVPRIYERIYAAVTDKAARSALASTLLRWTQSVGWRRFEALQGRAAPLGLAERCAWWLLQPLVPAKLLARFGGRLRLAVTGGARMSPEIARFLVALGLPLAEGYGLAEAASPVCCNTVDDNLIGSVGTPFGGVQVKTVDDGELLVQAPGVMQGYWNQPEKTKETIDPEGWLHTGDLAEIQDGRVFIRGRKKEILVTSTGENVPPADVEAAIFMDPLFEQVMVIGDAKPFLAALLVLDREHWREFAQARGLDPDAPDSLRAPVVIADVLAILQQRLDAFPAYAQVRAVHLALEPWAIEAGLLTTTMKLKRGAIEERFAADIDALYRDRDLTAGARRTG